MSVIINGTDGVQFNDSSLQGAAASPFGLKNRIINGDMRIDQRNAGASVTPTNGAYTLDRYQFQITQTSKFTVQQNAAAVTLPVGFTNYLGATSSSAYSILSSDYFALRHLIEGFNTSDLDFGKATAKTITLSFWVRSSLTGTFGGVLFNSATDRTYVFSYTISTANTWEQKSITIAGDTSGTWLTTNGIGIGVDFTLASGSNFTRSAGSWSTSGFAVTGTTSVVGTNGATFYITGVQLEIGSTATPFERRMFGTELQLCQRYYAKVKGDGVVEFGYGSGLQVSTTNAVIYIKYPCTMRASPTITGSSFQLTDHSGFAAAGTISTTGAGLDSAFMSINMAANGAALRPIMGYITAASNGYIDFRAEL